MKKGEKVLLVLGALLIADGLIDVYFIFRVYRAWKK